MARGMPSSRRHSCAISRSSLIGGRRGTSRLAGANDEELDRVRAAEVVDGGIEGRCGEHRYGNNALPRDAQPLATGDEHPQVGRDAERFLEQGVDGRHQMLAVVEHDQHALVAHVIEHGLPHGGTGPGYDFEGGGQRLVEQRFVAHPGQRYEPHAVGECAHRSPGHLEREPGLTDTSDPDQGDDRALAQELRDRDHVALTTDECARRRNQVPSRRVLRAKARKLPGQLADGRPGKHARGG